MRMSKNSKRGFSLLELLIAMSIGLIVVLAASMVFKSGMDASIAVTQRAEVQENLRAGMEMMTKDISMAGAGLPSGGLQLSTAGVSKYGCNQAGTCYIPNGTYPNSAAGTANYMYAIEPGFGDGVQASAVIAAAPAAVNSSITSVYCDYNFPLTNFSFTFPNSTTSTVAVVNGALTPNNILAPGGLNVGDLILFSVSTPGTGTAGNPNGNSMIQNAAVVAEVTGIPNQTTIDFATSDALNFNQTGGSDNLAAVATASAGVNAQTTACRLEAVSYFLQVPAAGGTVQTPRLMRQVNGLNAVPVADNIINLQFTYDIINSVAGTVNANVQNPIAAGLSPSLIQKVNIFIMGNSMTTLGNKNKSLYLATSVATSDMSFCNSYSSSTTVCQ